MADAGDSDCAEILELARGGVTADLLGCLVERDLAALARYAVGHRAAALRERSAVLLRDALLASAICAIGRGRDSDPRDVMVGLAVCYFVAEQIELIPFTLFGEIASCLPDGWMPGLLRGFGARQDISLKAFGWQLVQTPQGPDVRPAPY